MHALRYFFVEAAASLTRRPGAAIVAILTMATGIFVLGLFLVASANVRQLLDRWSEAAELSIFLDDAATPDQIAAVEALADASGVVAARARISKEAARDRFKADFPDLAATAAALDSNPFPSSVEMRLTPEGSTGSGAVTGFVSAARALPGVSDVRYDRQWLERLNGIVRGGRIAAGVVIGILAIAAAMTVANVVRLAAAARRDEIEIMQLVGAPIAYVRGPFVAEGILQGGIGAAIAIAALGGAFQLFRWKYGTSAAETLGLQGVAFLDAPLVAVLVLGGMVVGAIGSYAAARTVR